MQLWMSAVRQNLCVHSGSCPSMWPVLQSCSQRGAVAVSWWCRCFKLFQVQQVWNLLVHAYFFILWPKVVTPCFVTCCNPMQKALTLFYIPPEVFEWACHLLLLKLTASIRRTHCKQTVQYPSFWIVGCMHPAIMYVEFSKQWTNALLSILTNCLIQCLECIRGCNNMSTTWIWSILLFHHVPNGTYGSSQLPVFSHMHHINCQHLSMNFWWSTTSDTE